MLGDTAGMAWGRRKGAAGHIFDAAKSELAVLQKHASKDGYRNSARLEHDLGRLGVMRGLVIDVVCQEQTILKVVGPHDSGSCAVFVLDGTGAEVGVITVAREERGNRTKRLWYPIYVDGRCVGWLDDPFGPIQRDDSRPIVSSPFGLIRTGLRLQSPEDLPPALLGAWLVIAEDWERSCLSALAE